MSLTTTPPLLTTPPPLSTTPPPPTTQLRKVIFALQQELAEQLNDSNANKPMDKADDGNNNNNNNNNDDGQHAVADLSDARLEQFRSDLERVGSDDSSPCVITAADYQAIIPALACGTTPPLGDHTKYIK